MSVCYCYIQHTSAGTSFTSLTTILCCIYHPYRLPLLTLPWRNYLSLTHSQAHRANYRKKLEKLNKEKKAE